MVSRIHCPTARRYQIWKEGHHTSLAAPPSADDRSSPQAVAPDALVMPSPASQRGFAFVAQVATTTDLLLLAMCILINIPSVAKLITSSSDALPVSDTQLAVVSVAGAGLRSALAEPYPHDGGLRAAMEQAARALSTFLVSSPLAVCGLFERVCVGLASTLPYQARLAPYTANIASLWREGLMPCITPPVFWTVLLVLLVVARLVVYSRRVCVEELVVVRGLGMQLYTRDFVGNVTRSKFLDVARIRSVFIHEAFFRQQVIFYLGVLVDNEADVTVLFEETLPRLALLKPLLCGIRAVLFQEVEDGSTLGEQEDRGCAES